MAGELARPQAIQFDVGSDVFIGLHWHSIGGNSYRYSNPNSRDFYFIKTVGKAGP